MSGLTAHQLLELSERVERAHPLDRALAILETARPELGAAAADLPIGSRDRLLLALQAETFGQRLDVETDCAACGEGMELTLTVDEATAAPPPEATLTVRHGRKRIACRLPTSRDLAAVANAGLSGVASERLLVERCLIEPKQTALSDEAIGRVGNQLASADPAADLVLAAVCPACGEAAELLLDPLVILWANIDTQRRALMWEIAQLARAFGWREADILAMPPVRRRRYLALAAP